MDVMVGVKKDLPGSKKETDGRALIHTQKGGEKRVDMTCVDRGREEGGFGATEAKGMKFNSSSIKVHIC